MDAAQSDAVGAGENGPPSRRSDTRARIQHVALELFAEQGYERTSLREIAERLGVTKAALYYHFKSKEDIVRSFTEDYFGRLDALIAWGRGQAGTRPTRHELFDRYIAIVIEGSEVFRFLERNQASLHSAGDSGGGKHRFAQFRPQVDALVEIITGPDAPTRSRIRATSALLSVSAACMFFMGDPAETTSKRAAGADTPAPPKLRPPERDELSKIVLEIADDLTGDIGTNSK
jgi:AcrR family transcriptional regulator